MTHPFFAVLVAIAMASGCAFDDAPIATDAGYGGGSGAGGQGAGAGGDGPSPCYDDGNPCTADTHASNGRCANIALPDGSSCPSQDPLMVGTCRGGVCFQEPWSCKEHCQPVDPDPCRTYSCEGQNEAVCVIRDAPNDYVCGDRSYCHNGTCRQLCAAPEHCDPQSCKVAACSPNYMCIYVPSPDGTACSVGTAPGECNGGTCSL